MLDQSVRASRVESVLPIRETQSPLITNSPIGWSMQLSKVISRLCVLRIAMLVEWS